MGGYWGNKGCVGVRWSVYGVSVCVLNCHLAAHTHMNKVSSESCVSALWESRPTSEQADI